VTGGAGFIGSLVVRRLIDAAAYVLAVDDLSVGRAWNYPSQIEGRSRALEGDIRDPHCLEEIVAFDPEVAIHLAAIHYIPYCLEHPDHTRDVNVGGTEAVLSALRRTSIRGVVFASSAAVYGFSDDALSEVAPIRPDSVYGESKVEGEHLLELFHEERGDTRCIALRFFNAYGPNETNRHVIPHILAAHLADRVVALGSRWPERDYVFVEDVAKAVLRATQGPPTYQVFNVGTGIGTSVDRLLQAIERVTGVPPHTEHDPRRVRDSEGHLVADISSIGASLAWHPQVSLERGLQAILGSAGYLATLAPDDVASVSGHEGMR
jgi:UDP-glucose 4-epimerase